MAVIVAANEAAARCRLRSALANGRRGADRVAFGAAPLHPLRPGLLCFAGMGWRVAEDPASPSGHRIVFFADSYRWPENPSSRGREGRGKPSAPSARGPGIRFQRAAAVEEQDSVQAWVALRALQPGAAATLHWDARAKRSVAASVATHVSPTGPALAGRLDWL